MTTYRAGQRVRIEIEGMLRTTEDIGSPPGGLVFQADDGWPTPFRFVDGDFAGIARNGIITVLSEPRPEEPTGLGAVVEAAIGDWEPRRWLRTFTGHWATNAPIVDVPWADLLDPVVLSQGWTS